MKFRVVLTDYRLEVGRNRDLGDIVGTEFGTQLYRVILGISRIPIYQRKERHTEGILLECYKIWQLLYF